MEDSSSAARPAPELTIHVDLVERLLRSAHLRVHIAHNVLQATYIRVSPTKIQPHRFRGDVLHRMHKDTLRMRSVKGLERWRRKDRDGARCQAGADKDRTT